MRRFSKKKFEWAKLLDRGVKILGKSKEVNLHVEGPELGYAIDGGFFIRVTAYDSLYFEHVVDGDLLLYYTEEDAHLAFCREMCKDDVGFCKACWEQLKEDGVRWCPYKEKIGDENFKPKIVEVGWEKDNKGR